MNNHHPSLSPPSPPILPHLLLPTPPLLSAPPLIHSLLGAVLGLLLAFRTNQAYGRYWSACQSWAEMDSTLHNMARTASSLAGDDGKASRRDRVLYTSILRHLIAFPIALKQRFRGQFNMKEFIEVLATPEREAVVSPTPHLALLSSLSMLARPIKARDTGSGQFLALWTELSSGIAKLQDVTCSLDLVAQTPLPPSYTLLTSRFLFLWVATLPIVLLDAMNAVGVPFVMLLVAWSLYSTEELAYLMESPFGGISVRGEVQPETLALDLVCDKIVSELKQSAVVNRLVDRRVESGQWVVKAEELELRSAMSSKDSKPSRYASEVDVDARNEVE